MPLTPHAAVPSPPQVPARRIWLRRAGWVAAGVAVAGGAGAAGLLLHRPANDRRLVFASLDQAMHEAERLSAAGASALEPATAFNWAQTLEHCAQSIEYSMVGFPAPRSALFQHTLGAAAFAAFTAMGRMQHSLSEPIPGAPALATKESDVANVGAALQRLRQAVQDFGRYTGPLQPHFAYGALRPVQYAQAHAMHLANHFSAFDVQSG